MLMAFMMKSLQRLMLTLAITCVAVIVLLGPPLEEAGCACVPPPTLGEIEQLKKVAEEGDTDRSIEHIGRVAFAYKQRGEDALAAKWQEQAIEAGDPYTLTKIADLAYSDVKDASEIADKIALTKKAIEYYQLAYPRRRMLEDVRKRVYASQLRSARATLAVLKDGKEVWLTRAESGDLTAVYSMARYFIDAELDQEKRRFWEKRGAELGDPELADEEACCWRRTEEELLEGQRIVERAKANGEAIGAIEDEWIRAVILEDIDSTEIQIKQRLAILRQG